MNLLDTLNNIIKVEGTYSDHPSDKGGPTMYGVTEQVARSYGYQGNMKDLPRDTAIAIYTRRYWINPKLDQVASISEAIAEELLDTGINMGQATAIKFLQRALNTLNKQASQYPDLPVDGGIGPMTLYALKRYLTLRGKAGETVLLRMLNAQQSVRYIEIAERNPNQEDFMFGWQNARVA